MSAEYVTVRMADPRLARRIGAIPIRAASLGLHIVVVAGPVEMVWPLQAGAFDGVPGSGARQ